MVMIIGNIFAAKFRVVYGIVKENNKECLEKHRKNAIYPLKWKIRC